MTIRPVGRIMRLRRCQQAGFTLVELMLVMVIMAAILTVVVPRSQRSDRALEVEQHSLDMAALVRYAVDLADRTGRRTRVAVDTTRNTYHLEMADRDNPDRYEATPDAFGQVRFIGAHIRLVTEGFDTDRYIDTLVIDPYADLPVDARISLLTHDVHEQVTVNGRRIVTESPGSAY